MKSQKIQYMVTQETQSTALHWPSKAKEYRKHNMNISPCVDKFLKKNKKNLQYI